MGWEIGQAFRPIDDADGTGMMLELPVCTIHPNTATSKEPDAGWKRLYPYDDTHGWYAMSETGDYGPVLIGEVPATTFLTITADDVWFAGHAFMTDDAGGRQYGFQWFSSAAVTADHNDSYVGHVFGMAVPIANTKTESSSYYLAFFDSQRDTDDADDQGHLDAAYFGIYQEFGHGGGGTYAPETEYAVAFKGACYNGGGTVHNMFAFEAQPVNGGAGTTDLYVVLRANGGFGDEAMGIWATNDLKFVWEFQESDIIIGNTNDLLLGDGTKTGGKNYHVTSDAGGYNLDGIVAEGQNRDGAEVTLFNGNSSFNFNVLAANGAGTSASASSGNKVFATTAADLVWGAGQVLHLLYNALLFSAQGGWIAWIT